MSQADDFVLVSVDDHLIEPPDLFAGHLPAKYLDRAPRLVRRDDGSDVWTFNGATIENPARIGVDNICWEADYPHSDSMWPTAPEELAAVFAEHDVPDDEIAKITHENAMRWYQFDPFAHIPRERATVGALRRQAEGHDVSIMSLSRRVLSPDEKLAQFRGRAERAATAAAAAG